MACVLTGDRLAECEAERSGWPVDSSQQAPGANWRCAPASPLQPASVHIVCHGTALTGAGRACGSCMVSPPVLQAQRPCQNCCPDIVLTSCSWSMKQTRCRHPSRVHVHVTPRCGTPRASPAAATGRGAGGCSHDPPNGKRIPGAAMQVPASMENALPTINYTWNGWWQACGQSRLRTALQWIRLSDFNHGGSKPASEGRSAAPGSSPPPVPYVMGMQPRVWGGQAWDGHGCRGRDGGCCAPAPRPAESQGQRTCLHVGSCI